MRKKYLLIFIVILIGLFTLDLYTELMMLDETEPTSLSIAEARKAGILAGVLVPSPKEFDFNSSYNVIISEAWLEKRILRKQKLFWRQKEISNQLVLRVKPNFRNKKTGQIEEKIQPPIFLAKPDRSPSGTMVIGEKTLATYLDKDPGSEIDILFEEIGSSKLGKVVNFKKQ